MSCIPVVFAAVVAALALGTPALAEKRLALVIGNSAYAHSPALANPANDAGDLAAALRGLGFEVLLGLDLEKRAIDGRMREFARGLAKADVALFY